MKNTKKSLLFEIISLVVVVAIIGTVIALSVGLLKDAEGMIDDAFSKLEGESDTELSDNESSEVGSSVAPDGFFNGEYTYADGDVKIGIVHHINKSANMMVLYCDTLEPDSMYKIEWSLKENIEDYGFSFIYKFFKRLDLRPHYVLIIGIIGIENTE